MDDVISILLISRSEDAADFEWRIAESATELLERGRLLLSPFFYFAGWRWILGLKMVGPGILLLLGLFRNGAPSPSRLVRYWLGSVKVDGGREEEEIGRGRRGPGDSGPVAHPWLPLPELRRRMGCSATSSGTLSGIVRLRTGPETGSNPVDLPLFPLQRNPFPKFPPASLREEFGSILGSQSAVSEDGPEVSGSLLEISRSEDAADFEWRIPGSATELLESGWVASPYLYFAGGEWQLVLESMDPSSSSDPLVLHLCPLGAPSPALLVRYWLGFVKVDGGRKEEEIGRGRKSPDSPCSSDSHHPWLTIPELRRTMGCSSLSSGTLAVIARLRTGPETGSNPVDLPLFLLQRNPSPKFPPPSLREEFGSILGSQSTVSEGGPDLSGSLLEISLSEHAADLEWRIPGSATELLESGWVVSPSLYFAGGEWKLVLESMDPSSSIEPLVLHLCPLDAPSPALLVRYWLGFVKVDGGRKEEEIGRGRRNSYSPCSSDVYHPWLTIPELRTTMGCSSPSSGTLAVIVRLRTGPETGCSPADLPPFPCGGTLPRSSRPLHPEKNSDPSAGSQSTFPEGREGTSDSAEMLEISRREDAADFEWRIPESETECLERGWLMLSPTLSFAGWGLRLFFGCDFPSSDSHPRELSLCQYPEESSPAPIVRYWLGSVKVDGRREEEEIARGWWEPCSPCLADIWQPWLTIPELRRRMRCSSPSSGTLSVIVRLRTGPETDDEMKSLLEREEPTLSQQEAAELFTQTLKDIEDDEMRSLVEPEQPTSSLEGTAEKFTQTDVEDDEMRSLVEREEPTSNLECTAEKDTQTDVEDFYSKVFETLKQLSDEVEEIKILLQSSTKEPVPNNIPAGCPSFPITTEEDLKKFEEYLKIKEQFYSVCTSLSTIGGLSVKDCTRRILQKIISNNLSLSYNWKGLRGSKTAFSSLENVNALILGAVRMHKNFQDATDFEIQSTVKLWLMHAKDRTGNNKFPS